MNCADKQITTFKKKKTVQYRIFGSFELSVSISFYPNAGLFSVTIQSILAHHLGIPFVKTILNEYKLIY